MNSRAFAVLLAALAAAGCAEDYRSAAGATDIVYTHALADIGSLYVDAVSLRRVALAGAARLNALDPEMTASDAYSGDFNDAVAIRYQGRDVATLTAPANDDPAQWGSLLGEVVATARHASPALAAMPPEKIQTAILQGMTGALDPYSRYSAPDAARSDRAERDGSGGVGVTLDAAAHDGRIAAVRPDSPAAEAGLRPDDRIVAIDGVATAGTTPENILAQLRGAVGSPITLRLSHPGEEPARQLQLQRALMTPRTVSVSRDGGLAVFEIASFNRSTAQDVAAALQDITRQSSPPTGIVLDMRGNPGGLLDQAVDLANLFIEKGAIAAAVGRSPASRQYFAATGNAIAPGVPLVVLVNGGSASASEIVAAAMQDAGRAVVVGSSTYGKGTVQTVLRLPSGGELVLSWARLIAPGGYLLQYHGVVPTICTASGQGAVVPATIDLQRAIATPPAGLLRPRAGLDEPGWTALRQECPPLRSRNPIDLAVAERLLADPKSYAQALLALPAASRHTAAKPGLGLPGHTLTAASRGLSSQQP